MHNHVFRSCEQTLMAGVLLIQTIVVDARAHMLGRLASILAKQLLGGQQVVSPAPKMLFSSSLLSFLKVRPPLRLVCSSTPAPVALACKTWQVSAGGSALPTLLIPRLALKAPCPGLLLQ